MADHFDIVIVGSGPGGYVAALKAGQLGARVAVVEKGDLGGTCLNRGCIPSKALLSSAELLHQMQHADEWGLTLPGAPGFDWTRIQKHKDRVIRQLRGGVGNLFKARKVTLIQGEAVLDAPGRVAVQSGDSTRVLTGDKVILATGSSPARIPGWPDDPQWVCTSDESVHWKDLPKKLLIVGGGVIGCEFACLLQPLGVDVTVVEMLPGLLPGLDHELGQALHAVFKQRGIACHVDTRVDGMSLKDGGLEAVLSNGKVLHVDRVLVATGRKPNTAQLGLERAGIELGPRGFIPVNDFMETSLAGHYCIGDANGRCLLAHAASAHGVAAVEHALNHSPKPFHSPIPSAVYTFPEIGAVGMTEQDAKEKGLPISIGHFPIGHLGKAMASHHTEGFVKTIRNRETDELLGVHMLGHAATECIAAAGALLHQQVSMHDFAETVFAHPTISEALKESAEDALGMGLHLPPRKLVRVQL
ncbi:MAG TPA: dihydrolipoyl dehydrogenase [Verrucomicrobia bacterium]|jgi:dihydrolipoamide dehydrogenase|nr:dihydrolipoyl dehydrogenase [Verrucomicrobiota bacterium]